MAYNPELRAHQEWIGYLQPVGLVVSGPALLASQAHVHRNILREQEQLRAMVGEPRIIADFRTFARELLGWQANDLVDASESLSVALTEYHETLRPTFSVTNPDKKGAWTLLVQVLPAGTDLDATPGSDCEGWSASPQVRFERLLRETNNPVGLLCNGHSLRLIYAPRGETSGHVTFPVAAMCETAGRPILGAVLMLLGADRLFNVPTEQRLPAILRESRRYQNEVSTRLADQVLTALHELLRGFQAADEASKGALLGELRRGEGRQEIYGGLLTTLMRLVFVLYAEDRGLMPASEVYVKYYSIAALFETLRNDVARFPDTMDQRYGAWAQLLTLFRFVFDGASHGSLHMPARHGQLFDPDAYPFLEGRPRGAHRSLGEKITPPPVSDGTIHRVLESLLILDGERLSYRALDVEQIGSVYEAMMGFELEEANGPSIAIRPHHVVVNLQGLLEKTGKSRLEALQEATDCKLAAASAASFQAAKRVEELVAALDRRVSPQTQGVLPAGSLYLQPGQERRRSGSHYTPRSLTEPIVRTTLGPVIAALGANPTPEQILELKVCDPAMGSGAFLVEVCRFLGNALKDAWERHKTTPKVPLDEDVVLHARRLVAQRCLYGVDKNPFAVNLAKLSLWLVTLAREHPFTFLDHALRCGDSLVGLDREQIACFHWKSKQIPLIRDTVDQAITTALPLRAKLHGLGDSDDAREKERLLCETHDATSRVRIVGDLVIGQFLRGENDKKRDQAIREAAVGVASWLRDERLTHDLKTDVGSFRAKFRLEPFHWQIEFPEVFSRGRDGFDAFVGNPPFLGGTRISTVLGAGAFEWLKMAYPEAGNRMDLVAYFFRRAFSLLRDGGTLGFVATNTVAQGDTRQGGLRWIREHGGTIFAATRRIKWPGSAAVVVSVVHIKKGAVAPPYSLDGQSVNDITAFLFPAGPDTTPVALHANDGLVFEGYKIYGQGFLFDDRGAKSTSLTEMRRLIALDPRNNERIFPYLGGEEVNDSPTLEHRRWVIDFGTMAEEEARQWPDLMKIVEEKVRPERAGMTNQVARVPWWRFFCVRPELRAALLPLKRALVCSKVTTHLAFAWLPTNVVFSHKLAVFVRDSDEFFGVLQSQVHEVFVRFFSSTLGDALNYSSTDAFAPFPLPSSTSLDALASVAKEYDEYRAELMKREGEGLTRIYNHFHDPSDTRKEIEDLRARHRELDRAVLRAYGWSDLPCESEFEGCFDDERASGRNLWRYRWPEGVRNEVIGRLLSLNAARVEQERLEGVRLPPRLPRPGKSKRKPRDAKSKEMFGGGR